MVGIANHDPLPVGICISLHCCIAVGSAAGADYYSGSGHRRVEPAEWLLHLHLHVMVVGIYSSKFRSPAGVAVKKK